MAKKNTGMKRSMRPNTAPDAQSKSSAPFSRPRVSRIHCNIVAVVIVKSSV